MSDTLPWEMSLALTIVQVAAAHARRLLRDAEVHYGQLARAGIEIPGVGRVKLSQLQPEARASIEEGIAALRFAVAATEREQVALERKMRIR